MRTTRPRMALLPPLLLGALVLGAWGGGLAHGLQGDDAYLLTSYLRVRAALPPLLEYFRTPSWGLFYRPLGAYLGDRLFALSWPDVAPIHAVALGVHVLGVLGVARLSRLIGLPPAGAWGAAVVFALLPVHAEPVLWIAALHGMLENVVGLWAIVLLIQSRRGEWRPWRAAAGVVLFVCALAIKESGLVGLGILALHDLFWRRDLSLPAKRPGALLAVYGPMVLGVALLLFMRRAVYGGWHLEGLNTPGIVNLSSGVVRTVLGVFCPVHWRPVEAVVLPPARTAVGAPLAILLVLLPTAVAVWRRAWRTVWLWCSLGGALVPLATLGVVPAERHLYLPSVFGALLLASAALTLAERLPRARIAIGLLSVGWVVAAFGTARARVAVWGDAALHVRAVLDQTAQLVPAPTADTLLLYLGVPDEVDGAYVFRFTNLPQFLRAEYGLDTLEASMVCLPAEIPVELLAAPGAVQFLIQARGGNLYWPDSMRGGPFAPYERDLVARALLGRSWLLADWLVAGKPAYVLLYDADTRTLRLGDDALRADIADKLLWVDYRHATPVQPDGRPLSP